MKYKKKTKKQLVEELQLLQGRISELESRTPQSVTESGKPAKVEEGFQTVFNKSLDATLIIDGISGKILAANESTANIFGYGNDFLLGKHFSILFSTAAKREKKQSAKLVESYDSVFTQEFLRADGTVCAMDLIATLIPWGKEKAILAAFRDATERKAAEARVQNLLAQVTKSHDDFLSILNMLNLGIIALDEEDRITFINQTAHNITGERKQKILQKKWNRVLPFQKEDIPRIKKMLRRSASKRQNMEAKFEIPGGKAYWLEIEIHTDPRNPEGKILFVYDVSEIHNLRNQLTDKARFLNIIGKSEPMKKVFQQIGELSNVDTTVLIEGDTGTGKELAARAIHEKSNRKNGPFIAVNCAGLIESLVASQLFGHKRGAFTGATEDRIGVFETASGGTLFLDEIGEIPLHLQANLLRVLQERVVERVGESRQRKVDVRVISATNRDLKKQASSGQFRIDLLYRIRVATIQMPLLRERQMDIPLLVRHFLDKLSASIGKSVKEVETAAMKLLMNYRWPGNVRELENVIETALIHCNREKLSIDDLPIEITAIKDSAKVSIPGNMLTPNQIKKQRLLEALEQTNGNRAMAARLLGIGRTTLYRQLKKFDLLPSD
jgi:PAS domain S-box-containing protein